MINDDQSKKKIINHQTQNVIKEIPAEYQTNQYGSADHLDDCEDIVPT